MLTVIFLTMGTLLIQEAYLRSLHLFGVYTHTFSARAWSEEKLWEGRDRVLYKESPETGSDNGSFTEDNKTFTWNTAVSSATQKNLYLVKVDVEWAEGNRPQKITREQYVFRSPKPLGS